MKINTKSLKFKEVKKNYNSLQTKFYTTKSSPILKKISDDFKNLPKKEQAKLKEILARVLGKNANNHD